MLFLLKSPKSKIDLNEEIRYNYTILCEISNKDISDILSAVWEIHSYEYTEFLTMPLKTKFDFSIEKNTSYELLKNLDIDRELIENYKYLNKLLKECNKSKYWYKRMQNIISCISIVHSNSYMSNLAEIAIKNKNFWIAEMIYEQQKNGNEIVKKIKNKLINEYNRIVDSLYCWIYKWSPNKYDDTLSTLQKKLIRLFSEDRAIIELNEYDEKLIALQRKLVGIFWENSDIVVLCEKVIKDISTRWKEILHERNHSEKDNRWHFYGNSI